MSIPVSIILPCYKRISQTKKTIDLILKSKGLKTDFTLEIIVADGTPDDSLKKSLLETFSSIIYTRPEKIGIAANKNQGAKLAKHELLIFCDSDMEVEPETVITAISSLKNRPKTAMLTGQIIWNKKGVIGQLDRPRKEDRIKKVGREEYLEAIYSRFLITYKSVFWQVGGYDEDLFNMRGEGSDLSIRYWRSGFPLGYDQSLKVYHVHEAQEAITRNIQNPEQGIVRDLIQLGYKYGLSKEESINFAKTLGWLKEQFGEQDKFILIKDMVALLPYFWENQEKLKDSVKKIPSTYDFKFLDIFTKEELFMDCLTQAENRLKPARKLAFNL